MSNAVNAMSNAAHATTTDANATSNAVSATSNAAHATITDVSATNNEVNATSSATMLHHAAKTVNSATTSSSLIVLLPMAHSVTNHRPSKHATFIHSAPMPCNIRQLPAPAKCLCLPIDFGRRMGTGRHVALPH